MTARSRRSRPANVPSGAATVVRAGVLAVVVSAVLFVAVRWVADVTVPYPVLLAGVAAALAGRFLIAAVRPPRPLVRPVREDSDIRVFGRLPDRPFAGVRRWEERLELMQGDDAYFRHSIVPDLWRLAEPRLSGAGTAERKELLGEQVWDLLTADARRRAPSPAELAAVVERLEELWARPR